MKKLTFLVLVLLMISTCICTSHSYAAVPHLINYQGRLTDSSGTPLNGSYNITFRIYDAPTAGNMLWQEAQTGVVIQKGIFSVLLGSVTALNLAFDKQYYLAVQVGTDPEMSPRQQLTSAGYALRAETAEQYNGPGKVGTKTVDETSLADGMVPYYDSVSGKMKYRNSNINQAKLGFLFGASWPETAVQQNASYVTLRSATFIKIPGLNNIKCHLLVHCDHLMPGNIRLTCGGVAGSNNIVSSETYYEADLTLDVSSLTDGIQYTVNLQGGNNASGAIYVKTVIFEHS